MITAKVRLPGSGAEVVVTDQTVDGLAQSEWRFANYGSKSFYLRTYISSTRATRRHGFVIQKIYGGLDSRNATIRNVADCPMPDYIIDAARQGLVAYYNAVPFTLERS